nr:PREDICTED: cytochrome P450 CYP72A219-like isoform X1 [Daucus carota subsp. sativus]
MGGAMASIVISVIVLVILRYTIKLANTYWFRPKRIEKRLRKLGFRGSQYRIIFGDAKDIGKMRAASTSKPMEPSDKIASRILPYYHNMVQKHGKTFFFWFGTKARLNISDPVLVKDILSRTDEFRKPNNDQMARVLVGGLFSSEGKTWAQHKKILNPAFHIDKTKNMVPSIVENCSQMMNKWNISGASNKSVEVEMRPEIDALIYEIMCKALVAGPISEEAKKIYQQRMILNQQAAKLTTQEVSFFINLKKLSLHVKRLIPGIYQLKR